MTLEELKHVCKEFKDDPQSFDHDAFAECLISFTESATSEELVNLAELIGGV